MKLKLTSIKMLVMLFIASTVLFTSCDNDDDDDIIPGEKVIVSGDITVNTTWEAKDTIYLDGYVYVKTSTVLTIEAGTLIKGISDTKAALIIERGAQIIAEGTAQKPIVFSSEKPAGERLPGDWAGIIVCGAAPINQTGGEAEMEGGTGALYGGTNVNDNSGIIKYVRIEFAGYEVSNGNEINGLSMGGVGSGTTIEYVQVSYGRDDSFEWWGGNVNARYLISFCGGDDDFDTDNGFSGKIQFGLILRHPDYADKSDASNGFESDNDANGSANEPFTSAIFSNITILGPFATKTQEGVHANHQNGLRLRRNTRLNLHNSIIAGFRYGARLEGPSVSLFNNGGGNLKNNVLAGNVNVFKTGDVLTLDEFETLWANGGNSILAENSDLLLTNAWNYGNVNPLPQAGSPVLTGASFSGMDTWFQTVSHKGAFGTTNWTQGWTNWDPQNTLY
jgi:hypothetical protein